MSKMLKALEKAKKEKEQINKTVEIVPTKAKVDFNIFYGISMVVLLFVMTTSLYANFQTLSALSNSNGNTNLLAGKLDQQNEHITKLEALVKKFGTRDTAQTRKLKNQVKELDIKVKKRENDISDIAIDYNILRVIVNDLTVTNQELMEQYIALNTQIEELKEFKTQKLSYQESKY